MAELYNMLQQMGRDISGAMTSENRGKLEAIQMKDQIDEREYRKKTMAREEEAYQKELSANEEMAKIAEAHGVDSPEMQEAMVKFGKWRELYNMRRSRVKPLKPTDFDRDNSAVNRLFTQFNGMIGGQYEKAMKSGDPDDVASANAMVEILENRLAPFLKKYDPKNLDPKSSPSLTLKIQEGLDRVYSNYTLPDLQNASETIKAALQNSKSARVREIQSRVEEEGKTPEGPPEGNQLAMAIYAVMDTTEEATIDQWLELETADDVQDVIDEGGHTDKEERLLLKIYENRIANSLVRVPFIRDAETPKSGAVVGRERIAELGGL